MGNDIRSLTALLPLISSVALLISCSERAPSCDVPGVRDVVERFGARLQHVSLTAPESIVVRRIREAYGPLVTSELLEEWTSRPSAAPGREVSSPWPERIEIRSVEAEGHAACRVEGDVIYITSVELAHGGAAVRVPFSLRVVDDGRWRIAAYETAAGASAVSSSDAAGAADVVRRYYDAIDARDFRRAYEMWDEGGTASDQTFEAFAAGFAEMARVSVEIGEPTRVEGAAGSRYVRIPVVIRAVSTDGDEQRFEGTYTLRRTVVDGASVEQRRWHIYSADIIRVPRGQSTS